MREIKFMAWNHYKDQMRVVSKIDFLMSRVWILNNRREEMHNPWPFSDCILLQYTGLKDKNGKEIYEGDIWQSDKAKSPSVIVWTTEDWIGFGIKNGDHVREFSHSRHGQVIGNIHKKPILLPKSSFTKEDLEKAYKKIRENDYA